VIALDDVPERLEMARRGNAEALDCSGIDVVEALKNLTGGRGPDSCIDAVGMEAHGTAFDGVYDRARQAVRLETDRPHVLRQAIQACRPGGTVSVPGVYGGLIDKFPIGAAFMKGLTIRMGQTHMQRYMKPLLERIQRGEIDPSFVITHRMSIDDAPRAYQAFRKRAGNCIKVVLNPN
jgi:threonine dehydrogenase-like Zn-dependent dehydrogenase